jgi:hypothetical protein
MTWLHLIVPRVWIAEELHDTPCMDEEALQVDVMPLAGGDTLAKSESSRMEHLELVKNMIERLGFVSLFWFHQ